jgi:hypothetical protein
MKNITLLFLTLLATSCQVSETLNINHDGSGNIEVMELRDENFFQKINLLNNEVEKEKFIDSTYVFGDFIKKHSKTFLVTSVEHQKVFEKYSNVKVRVKKNSYEKDFRNTYTQNFENTNQIVDLYKTDDYVDDIIKNYSLDAEEHYYSVSYTFDGFIFKRIVKITNPEILKKEIDRIENYKSKLSKFNPIQNYILNYNFSRPIKSISNPNAKISEDKKSLVLEFKLSDCYQNPEITNLEVVLE